MSIRRRQTLSAALLLLVMMMSLGMRVLHVHHYVPVPVIECNDCQHHVSHSGHLLPATDNGGDCMLCQWLTVPFVGEDTHEYNTYLTSRIARFCQSLHQGGPSLVQFISLRAPPSFL